MTKPLNIMHSQKNRENTGINKTAEVNSLAGGSETPPPAQAVPAAEQRRAIKDAIFASLKLAAPGRRPRRPTLLFNTREAVLAHALALGSVAMLMRCIEDESKPSATDAIKLAELALRLARPEGLPAPPVALVARDIDPLTVAAEKAYGPTQPAQEGPQ